MGQSNDNFYYELTTFTLGHNNYLYPINQSLSITTDMDISNYSSNHSNTLLPLNKRYVPTGKENVYFLSELNNPVTARRYNDDNSESDSFSSGENVDQSRLILGDITEMYVDVDTGSFTDALSVNERSETETNSSRRNICQNSKVNKKILPQNKNFLTQNLSNYSSVPSKPSHQSKALRA